MVSIQITPHDYAVATVQGTQEELNAVYADLPRWIEQQGHAWDTSVLWLEVYPRPYLETDDQLDLEVWLPLRPEIGTP